MSYVYIQSESNLFTVGFFDPTGKWHPESDYNLRDEAAQRASYMNGNPYVPAFPDDRFLEMVVADVSFICGSQHYFSDDPRADIKRFIAWAREFDNTYKPEAGEYPDAIFRFTAKKMMQDPIADKILRVQDPDELKPNQAG